MESEAWGPRDSPKGHNPSDPKLLQHLQAGVEQERHRHPQERQSRALGWGPPTIEEFRRPGSLGKHRALVAEEGRREETPTRL